MADKGDLITFLNIEFDLTEDGFAIDHLTQVFHFQDFITHLTFCLKMIRGYFLLLGVISSKTSLSSAFYAKWPVWIWMRWH